MYSVQTMHKHLFFFIVFYFVLAVVSAQFFDEAVDSYIFKPITTETFTVQTSGGSMKETLATIKVSNTLNAGSFYVGNLKVGIKSRPPTFNYIYKEVGRVPKAILTQTIKVCSVLDTNTYTTAQNQQQTQTLEQAGSLYQAQADAKSSVSSSKRRLLSTTTTSTGTTSDVFHPLDIDVALKALSSVLTQDKSLTSSTAALKTLNTWFTQATLNVNGNAADNFQIFSELKTLQDSINSNSDHIQAVNKAIIELGKDETIQLDKLATTINGNFSTYRQNFQGQIDSTYYMIGNLSLNIADLASTLITQTTNNQAEFLKQGEINAGINAALFYELTQTSLKRAASIAYFEVIKNIPDVFFPLVTDPGTPPVDGRVLVGSDTRILLETFYVMYDAHSTFGIGFKNIGVEKINWFLSTERQLVSVTPSVSLSNIITSLGDSQCSRPYFNTGITWMDINNVAAVENSNNNNTCPGWIEIEEQKCTTNVASYDWAVKSNNQKHTLDTTNCGNGAITNTYTVLKTFTDFQTYMSAQLCKATASTTTKSGLFYVTSVKTNAYNPITQSTNQNAPECSAPLKVQLAEEKTVMSYVIHMAYAAYTLIYNDLLRLEQKKYGRLAGGLQYEVLPFDYVPPIGNSTNTATYSPRMCHRITFNLAHQDTLPVYAVYPDPTTLVTKQIVREITKVDQSIPLDSTDGLSLDTPVLFDEDILLVDDATFLLPQSSLVVGSLNDPIYWYDIPSHLLSVSSNIFARKNGVTYYLMDVGELNTWSLPKFQAKNNNLYNALDAAVGANLFTVPVAYDSQGYPVCNVGSGLLDADTMNGKTVNSSRTCLGGYKWLTDTPLYTSITSVCDASYFGSFTPVKLYNRGVDLQIVSQFTAPWADGSGGFALHFLYEGLSSSTPVGLSLEDGTVITVVVDITYGLYVTVRRSGVSQTCTASFASLFNGLKHSILVFFTGTTLVDHVGIAVDGWLDQYIVLNRTLSSQRSNSVWNPPTARIPGVESVYGLSWPLGVPSTIFDASLVEALRICSLGVAENHCGSTNGAEALLFASPTKSVSGPGSPCPVASVSIFRSSVLDNAVINIPQTQGRNTILTAGDGFTITWWVHTNTQWMTFNGILSTYPLFSFQSGVSPNIFQCQCFIDSSKRLNVRVLQGSYLLVVLTATVYSVTNTLKPAKIAIRFQSGSISLFINQQIEAQALFTGFNAVNAGYTLTQMNKQGVVSLLRVYSYALSNAAIAFDLACDAASSSSYVNPVGFCRTIAGSSTPTSLYCQTPAMCDGNCETYAVYHSDRSSFDNTEIKQCSDGFLAPDCIHACPQYDTNTNVCLFNDVNDPAVLGSSGKLVPAGKWCDVLKHFQVSAAIPLQGSTSQPLSMTSRKYIMQVPLRIPTGQIVATASGVGGTCPNLQPFSLTGSIAQLTLTNPSASDIFLRVQWVTPFACNAIMLQERIIPAYLFTVLDVPSCGNITVILSTGTFSTNSVGFQYFLCTQFTMDNVASLLSSTATTQKSAIYSTAVIASDLALDLSLRVSQAITAVIFSLLNEFGLDITTYQKIYSSAIATYASTVAALNVTRNYTDTTIFTFTDPCGPTTNCGHALNYTTLPPVIVNTGGRFTFAGGTTTTTTVVKTDDTPFTNLLNNFLKPDAFGNFLVMLLLPYTLFRVSEYLLVYYMYPWLSSKLSSVWSTKRSNVHKHEKTKNKHEDENMKLITPASKI